MGFDLLIGFYYGVIAAMLWVIAVLVMAYFFTLTGTVVAIALIIGSPAALIAPAVIMDFVDR